MTLSRAEKLAIRHQVVAEANFERGRATTKRLLRRVVLPSAVVPMRLSDLGDGDDASENEPIATFSKAHFSRRRADGQLDIFRKDE